MYGRYKDYSAKDMKKLFIRKLKRPLYAGKEFQCPVCSTGLAKFTPAWKSLERELSKFIYPPDVFETFNRKGFTCPSCDASDRDRLYALYIKQWMKSLRGDEKYTFLDFAPNVGISYWMRGFPNITYKSVDLFRHNVDEKVDIQNMHQFASESVDGLICSHVLEHVPDDKAAMRELFRILKPGGIGLIMVPLVKGVLKTQFDPAHTSKEDRTKYYAQEDHLRLYGINDLMDELRGVGFEVQRLDVNYFGSEIFRKAGITESSALYVVLKPKG